MYRCTIISLMLLCAASAQAQVDIRDKIGKPRPDLGDKISAPQNKELIKHSLDPKKLQAAIGPVIQIFRTIGSCPYPDSNHSRLEYRVNPAPDGAAVRSVRILANYADDSPGTEIFTSPSTPTSDVITRGMAKDPSRSEAQYIMTSAFVLQATDIKGRTSSRRLTYNYEDPNARLQYSRAPNRPIAIQTHGETLTEYAFEFTVSNMVITSFDVPGQFGLEGPRHRVEAPVRNVQLWETYSPAMSGRRALRLPSRRFGSGGTTLVLTLQTPVYGYTTYGGTTYRDWSVFLRLGLRHPDGCSPDPRFIEKRLAGGAPLPGSEPEPEPEPEPLYNAYRSEVGCNCNNRYVWANATVEGCLYNQNGSQWLCTAAQPNVHRLLLPRIEEPVSETPVTTCTWIPGQYRRISDEMDCNDVRLDPVVTDIAGEE